MVTKNTLINRKSFSYESNWQLKKEEGKELRQGRNGGNRLATDKSTSYISWTVPLSNTEKCPCCQKINLIQLAGIRCQFRGMINNQLFAQFWIHYTILTATRTAVTHLIQTQTLKLKTLRDCLRICRKLFYLTYITLTLTKALLFLPILPMGK